MHNNVLPDKDVRNYFSGKKAHLYPPSSLGLDSFFKHFSVGMGYVNILRFWEDTCTLILPC